VENYRKASNRASAQALQRTYVEVDMLRTMYGSVVRAARRQRGLTQADLSAISGIEQPNISAIENDRRQPSVDTLHRLLLSCGFELVASAGPRVLAFPTRDDEPGDAVGPPAATPAISADDRVKMVVAVLDAAEAIVRNR
jgi:transcriptional regulator with XRE-family HTH domain